MLSPATSLAPLAQEGAKRVRPSRITGRRNERSARQRQSIIIGDHASPLLDPLPKAHAAEMSMIGPWTEERGSRMSESLMLPILSHFPLLTNHSAILPLSDSQHFSISAFSQYPCPPHEC